ncbi:extensin-like [Iris pallida]|uniref:Extensin-like n=1 Tax=Iris pallida TaxID=29817 RepID=A0AAX6FVQ7_IRIPA|nr:extensin-like [Iris pallida]
MCITTQYSFVQNSLGHPSLLIPLRHNTPPQEIVDITNTCDDYVRPKFFTQHQTDTTTLLRFPHPPPLPSNPTTNPGQLSCLFHVSPNTTPPLCHCQPPTHNQYTRFNCRGARVHHYHHHVQPQVRPRASMSVSFIQFLTTTV